MNATMMSLRKLMCKPKVDDWAPLAKFYHADENLNTVAAELDAFDGAKDPEKNQMLINQLRQCQDRVVQIIEEMINEVFPNECDRARRDYRVKFPDDIIHEGLPGQLWFGAECLSAGTNIVDRLGESEAIRPLARKLTSHLDNLREILKDQSLKNPYAYPEKLIKALRVFDILFAEFELRYVSIMVPVKSANEYDLLQDVCVLFSETLMRAISKGYIIQDMVDMCDPSIMITLPRLAIICGLLVYPDGPLNVDRSAEHLADMFQSFRTLLQKIRDLLRTLNDEELVGLEKSLSSQEQVSVDKQKVALMSDFRYRKSTQQGHSRRKSTTTNNGPPTSFYKTQTPPKIAPSGSKDDADKSGQTRRVDVSRTNVAQNPENNVDKGGQVAKCCGNDETRDFDVSPSKDDLRAKPNDECKPTNDVEECKQENLSAEDEKCDVKVVVHMGGESDGSPDVWGEIPKPSEITGSDDDQSIRVQIPNNNHVLRSRFWSSEDLIHRLFVCIAGVADQLQSNYPADLRTVLKSVLNPQPAIPVFEVHGRSSCTTAREEETGVEVDEPLGASDTVVVPWVPDDECPQCAACRRAFTFVVRRHHCRNCGQIFCARCSPNIFPLPQLGYARPVRVCNHCYFYKLNTFAVPHADEDVVRSTTATTTTNHR